MNNLLLIFCSTGRTVKHTNLVSQDFLYSIYFNSILVPYISVNIIGIQKQKTYMIQSLFLTFDGT